LRIVSLLGVHEEDGAAAASVNDEFRARDESPPPACYPLHRHVRHVRAFRLGVWPFGLSRCWALERRRWVACKQQVERGANWAEGLGSSIEQAAYEANTPKPRISDEAQIRERIEKRYKERSGVIAHAIPFLLVNLVLWSIYFGSPGSGFPWPMFVTFFWGIGMASHFFAYWSKYGGGADQRERAIQREIQQERERSLMYEKPKNDERDVRMRLTDDGELEEVPDDEISQAQKRKRNS